MLLEIAFNLRAESGAWYPDERRGTKTVKQNTSVFYTNDKDKRFSFKILGYTGLKSFP